MKKKINMTEMFKGYLDYSEEIRINIFKILEKLKNNLWILYQDGKEIFNNKNKVIFNSYHEYDEFEKKKQEGNGDYYILYSFIKGARKFTYEIFGGGC